MAGSLTSTCPECGTDIQSTWRWCLACGYDPDHLRPVAAPATDAAAAATDAPAETHARRRSLPRTTAPARSGVWFYAVVVVASLLAAGVVYTVRSRSTTSSAPATGTPGTVTTPAPTWNKFSPPNEGFTVELPGKVATQPAQPVTMAATNATVHAFTSVSGANTIGVTYADLGSTITKGKADDLLTDLLNEAADTLGGSVQSSQRVDDDGHPALDYVIDIRGTGKNQGRIVIVDTRVYTLNVIGPAPRQADVDHLLNSFSPA